MLKNALKKTDRNQANRSAFYSGISGFCMARAVPARAETAASAREDHLFYLTFAQFMI